MKKIPVTIVLFFFAQGAYSQFEGIEKGDNELTFNASITSYKSDEYESSNGTAFLSYGRYLTASTLVGIAPGLTMMDGSDVDANTIVSLQTFVNVNLVKNQPVIPYLRAVIYKFDISEDDPLFVQGGAGIKYFFSERAAWDTLLTYGRSMSSDGGSIIFLLTGLTYLF